ncbi:hypothetical protein ACTQ6A_11315 [Lachnospiraceae bacterium LCP25S3_G4]
MDENHFVKLSEEELMETEGGVLGLMTWQLVSSGIVVYGAFRKGYNDARR